MSAGRVDNSSVKKSIVNSPDLSSLKKHPVISPIKPMQATSLGSVELDLTDNQLNQMVKVAGTLPRDQQKMLV